LTTASHKTAVVPPANARPRAARQGISGLWAVGIASAVLYGSLIPFRFTGGCFGSSDLFGLLGLRWHASTPEDYVTNLLLYVPLGMALVWARRIVRLNRVTGLVVVVAIGTLISTVAEMLQTGIAIRVASWTDVLLNAAGTACGALLGLALLRVVRRAVPVLRARIAARPLTTIVLVLGLGLFLFSLAPFDFVTSSAGLHAAFSRAQWNHFSFTSASGSPIVGKFTGAAWFALLGYFAALAGREIGRRPVIALASALKQVAVLVVVVEIMQVFTRSHVFAIADIMLHGVSALVGAWAAVFLINVPIRSDWRMRPRLVMPTGLLVVGGMCHIAVLAMPSLLKVDLSQLMLSLSGLGCLPFESMWRGSMAGAAMEIASTLLEYGVLVLTLAILLRRARLPHAWLIVGGFVTLLALVLAAIQSAASTARLDLTVPILALFAAAIVARGYPALRPLLIGR
jgi:VanZ family protein